MALKQLDFTCSSKQRETMDMEVKLTCQFMEIELRWIYN